MKSRGASSCTRWSTGTVCGREVRSPQAESVQQHQRGAVQRPGGQAGRSDAGGVDQQGLRHVGTLLPASADTPTIRPMRRFGRLGQV
ncbi:hypothetical protein AMK19_25465 [Kitasatospora sp. CB01950]|nr:hypothetical protein AMK19_25465 [Kitasatospora sp. CB01950]